MKDSNLWSAFEIENKIPFHNAIILGDSAYPETDWLIPPFRGDHGRRTPKGKFNKSHSKTRSSVERTIGVIKKRFFVLKEGFRLHNLEKISKIIKGRYYIKLILKLLINVVHSSRQRNFKNTFVISTKIQHKVYKYYGY